MAKSLHQEALEAQIASLDLHMKAAEGALASQLSQAKSVHQRTMDSLKAQQDHFVAELEKEKAAAKPSK